MSKIDTEKIKEITKEKIAYANFEREEKMKKNRIAKIITFIFILGIFVCGTLTVNALTDNAIINSVKDALKIKVNGKEYNSNCVDDGNGMITCNISKEVTGNGSESSITISKDYIDKIEAEYTDEGMSITINE